MVVGAALEGDVGALEADGEAVGEFGAGVAEALAVLLSAVAGVSEGETAGAGVVDGEAIGVALLVKAPDPTRIAVVPSRTRTSKVAMTPGVNAPFFFCAGATRGARGRRVLPPLRCTGAAIALSFCDTSSSLGESWVDIWGELGLNSGRSRVPARSLRYLPGARLRGESLASPLGSLAPC